MSLRIKYTEQKPVPEGFYVARLDGLEPVTNNFGDSVKWTFTIQMPQEYVGVQVTGMSSTKVSPKSKMFGWLQAFGVVLNPDEEFDIEVLLGKLCQIRVHNKTKKTVIDGRENTTTYSNVDAVAKYIPPQNISQPVQNPIPQQTHLTQSAQNLTPNSQPTQNVTPYPQPQTPVQPQQNNTISPDQVDPDADFDF